MSLDTNMNAALYADVILAQGGDQQAFTRLIQQTSNMVSSIALAIVKDLDSSEDVAQQVYIGAWQQLKNLQNSTSILPWLRQMTRYKALNFLRDNKVNYKVDAEQADLLLAQFCDPRDDIDTELQREQQSVIVSNFIQQLPAESREIVLLYYREEQSSQQVARLLEQSEANIRQKLSRVRKLLQEQILAKHGRLLLSTAPTMGFSAMVLGAMTTSAPATAATFGSATASGKSSFIGKLAALLGGSMIGALFGVFAVRISTIFLLKKITSEEAKYQVLQYRKTTTIWLIFSAILLTISYELTSGWWAPVGAYLLFASVLFFRITRFRRFLSNELCGHAETTIKQQRLRLRLDVCYWFGAILGFGGGFAGMIIGLINSGRLPL